MNKENKGGFGEPEPYISGEEINVVPEKLLSVTVNFLDSPTKHWTYELKEKFLEHIRKGMAEANGL